MRIGGPTPHVLLVKPL